LAGRNGGQAAHPTQIVVMVHGYSDTRKHSALMFKAVSGLIDASFRERNQRVLVVVLQWHAALAGNQLPWREMPDYLKGVARARAVGHVSMRQLVARIQKIYPQVPVTLFTRSLGCEGAAPIPRRN
jgi:hypothetical protein